MTIQKLHAVMRKAGHKKAQWLKSGRIKGWGHWTEGYDIRQHDKDFELHHITGDWKHFKEDEYSKYVAPIVKKYHETLVSAGIDCKAPNTDHVIIITR